MCNQCVLYPMFPKQKVCYMLHDVTNMLLWWQRRLKKNNAILDECSTVVLKVDGMESGWGEVDYRAPYGAKRVGHHRVMDYS